MNRWALALVVVGVFALGAAVNALGQDDPPADQPVVVWKGRTGSNQVWTVRYQIADDHWALFTAGHAGCYAAARIGEPLPDECRGGVAELTPRERVIERLRERQNNR